MYQGRWPAEFIECQQLNVLWVIELAINGIKEVCYSPTMTPRGHTSVHRLEILLQPIQLRVSDGTEWPAVFPFTSSRLIRRDQAMSKVGLGINMHIMSHSGIEGIPEVSEAV